MSGTNQAIVVVLTVFAVFFGFEAARDQDENAFVFFAFICAASCAGIVAVAIP